MTDIVERLRYHKVSQHHGGCADCYAVTMEEAADEIERLRIDNKHWQTIASQGITIERELRLEIERLK